MFWFMSEEELLKQLNKNNPKALEVLIKKYQAGLLKFVVYFLKDKEIALEVVSDVFIYLWLHRHQLKIKENLKGYLFQAARNQALQILRKKKIPLESLDTPHNQQLISEEASDGPLSKKEAEAQINSSLSFLPEQQRLVFRLHRFEGFTYAEIAEMLQISAHTVRNHMFQALKQLKERFGNK